MAMVLSPPSETWLFVATFSTNSEYVPAAADSDAVALPSAVLLKVAPCTSMVLPLVRPSKLELKAVRAIFRFTKPPEVAVAALVWAVMRACRSAVYLSVNAWADAVGS